MSRVLIVARTRMHHGHVCVGGHDLDRGFRSVRLLDLFGDHWPTSSTFAVGDVWEVDYREKRSARPPHVEDTFVRSCELAGRQEDLREFLLQRVRPWAGPPDVLFDGMCRATDHGAGYVPADGKKPARSTGYWLPDTDLEPVTTWNVTWYVYKGSRISYIKWVGVQACPPRILAGTLVRVSLTRLFGQPPVSNGFYLQLSGKFVSGQDTIEDE